MKRVLLVSTWGCPGQWRNAEYALGSDLVAYLSKLAQREVDSGKCLVHCTSTALLVEVLKELGTDVEVVLIALDSIVDRFRPRTPIDSPCFRCYDSAFESLGDPSASISDYSSLLSYAKRLVESIAHCLLGNSIPIHVVVAPAIGSPGGRWVFSGGARDFAAIVLAELYRVVKEFRPDALILDVTHGVNYMPTETMHVARLALSALNMVKALEALRQGDAVSQAMTDLVVVNSDPYPPGAAKPRLSINIVYREIVRGIERLTPIPRQILRKEARMDQETEKKLREIAKLYLDYARVYAFLTLPAPLALSLACSEVSTRRDIDLVSSVIELWTRCTSVEGMSVHRSLKIVPEAVYTYALAREVCSFIDGGYDPREGASLDLLKRLAELYSVVDEVYQVLASNEVGKIIKSAREVSRDEWIKLYKLSGGEHRERKQIDKRVFIAHGGLQSEFVEVNPSKSRIRYVEGLDAQRILKDLKIAFEDIV